MYRHIQSVVKLVPDYSFIRLIILTHSCDIWYLLSRYYWTTLIPVKIIFDFVNNDIYSSSGIKIKYFLIIDTYIYTKYIYTIYYAQFDYSFRFQTPRGCSSNVQIENCLSANDNLIAYNSVNFFAFNSFINKRVLILFIIWMLILKKRI